MIIEGVNFNEEQVQKMKREDFISRHESALWQNRDAATRKKMLEQAYDLIVKPAKSKKKSETD